MLHRVSAGEPLEYSNGDQLQAVEIIPLCLLHLCTDGVSGSQSAGQEGVSQPTLGSAARVSLVAK